MITFSPLENCGRLGNQLWQIASTVGIAYALGDVPRFPNTWSYQPFFSVPEEMFIEPRDLIGIEAHDTAQVLNIDPRARIYLQDWNLWKDVEDYVRQIFRPSMLAADLCASILPNLPRPWHCLHVRRGDNAADPNEFHPLRPDWFYDKALEYNQKEEGSVLCFSDDINWCRDKWGSKVAYYHEGIARPKEHEPDYHGAPVLDWIDLHLMTQCDTHVVPNSTYGWWGAFLSDDRHPCYSWPWFGKNLQYIDASLMFPPGWARLYLEGNHANRYSIPYQPLQRRSGLGSDSRGSAHWGGKGSIREASLPERSVDRGELLPPP